MTIPDRIFAKVHGASTDVISGRRGLIGGWNEHQREGQVEFVRVGLAGEDASPSRSPSEDDIVAVLKSAVDADGMPLHVSFRGWVPDNGLRFLARAIRSALFPPSQADRLDDLLRRAREMVDAMTPEQRAAMHEAQLASFLRSMEPCEHGIRDWETCPDCRGKAREEG